MMHLFDCQTQVEGREGEKILAFYPPASPPSMQSSIVGLAQALTMFAGTFNKVCLCFVPLSKRSNTLGTWRGSAAVERG
jgi:hypothetical protein